MPVVTPALVWYRRSEVCFEGLIEKKMQNLIACMSHILQISFSRKFNDEIEIILKSLIYLFADNSVFKYPLIIPSFGIILPWKRKVCRISCFHNMARLHSHWHKLGTVIASMDIQMIKVPLSLYTASFFSNLSVRVKSFFLPTCRESWSEACNLEVWVNTMGDSKKYPLYHDKYLVLFIQTSSADQQNLYWKYVNEIKLIKLNINKPEHSGTRYCITQVNW